MDEDMQGECISTEEPIVAQQPMVFSDVPDSKFVVNYLGLFSSAPPPFKLGVNVGPT